MSPLDFCEILCSCNVDLFFFWLGVNGTADCVFVQVWLDVLALSFERGNPFGHVDGWIDDNDRSGVDSVPSSRCNIMCSVLKVTVNGCSVVCCSNASLRTQRSHKHSGLHSQMQFPRITVGVSGSRSRLPGPGRCKNPSDDLRDGHKYLKYT
jgi:hypothetical protein